MGGMWLSLRASAAATAAAAAEAAATASGGLGSARCGRRRSCCCNWSSPLLTHSCRTFHHRRAASPTLPPHPQTGRQFSTPHPQSLQQPRRSRQFSAAARPQSRIPIHHPASAACIPRRLFSSSSRSSIMADTQWPAARVRKTFFDFFAEREHTVVPSASVVPHNDPTLLFTNAGMNQFKPIFLGTVGKTDPMHGLKRAVDSQKVIRAGGKHNDLDDVGKDSYHHTFFEMLGSWSFGDYFKAEIIEMSWELLTKVYGLDPSRLYVTYFEGDADFGLAPDLEAKELWKKMGVPENQIIPGNMKDNFWEMGDQGPCGPCSEIHYDKIGGRDASHLVNMDDPMVIEIWNLVFMQFDRQADKSLKPLPAKHIDTGLGYERLVAVLQDVSSNYATDCWTPIFKQIQEVTGARPYTDKYEKDDVDGIDMAYRVVADHIRTLAFAIVDGAVPNNDGRGYVVRRVLRRGLRYGRKYLGAEIGTFFSKVLPALVEQKGEEFPELVKKQEDIKEILNEEEEAFARTLDRGEIQFERFAAKEIQEGSKKLPGDQVWRLYDTFGFPVDLTKLMAEERNLEIDEAEVEQARQRAKEASKVVKDATQQFPKLDVHLIAELDKQLKVPPTNDEAKFVRGDSKGKILQIHDGEKLVTSTKDLPANKAVGLLLDQTNFYAESGGQVADTGRLVIDGVAEFKVLDVQNYGGYILHSGYIGYGTLSQGDEVICEYEELRRAPIRNNHTGTHVLNHALREVLGDEVNQKGSLVDHEKLRFDFSHKSAVKIDELRKIEDMSNAYIRRGAKVYAKDVPLDDARQIEGVRAVFGETYPDPVRVVSIGMDLDTMLAEPKKPEWRQYSVEFCGGTHVEQTGLIKDLVIVEESGIAKGIRRIVAYTGEAAHQAQREAAEYAKSIETLEKLPMGAEKEAQMKLASQELSQLVISVLTKDELNKRYEKVATAVLSHQKKRQKEELKAALGEAVEYFKANEDAKWFVRRLPISANSRVVTEVLKHFNKNDKDKSVYLFSGSKEEGAVVHGVHVGTHLASQGITAEQWAASVTEVIGGRAGGKEPMRQGIGTKPEAIDDGVETATKWLNEKLKL